MERATCGYHSCSCRGINFISRYREKNDYCVEGKRVCVTDAGAAVYSSASRSDLDALGLFLLGQYAKYCAWHVEHKRNNPAVYGDMVLQPFSGSYPLRLKTDDGGRTRIGNTPDDECDVCHLHGEHCICN